MSPSVTDELIWTDEMRSRKYGTIEGILDNQAKYQPLDKQDYLESIAAARAIFLNPPQLDSLQCQGLSRGEPDPNLARLLRNWGIFDRKVEDEYGVLDEVEDEWLGVALDNVDHVGVALESALRVLDQEFEEEEDFVVEEVVLALRQDR